MSVAAQRGVEGLMAALSPGHLAAGAIRQSTRHPARQLDLLFCAADVVRSLIVAPERRMCEEDMSRAHRLRQVGIDPTILEVLWAEPVARIMDGARFLPLLRLQGRPEGHMIVEIGAIQGPCLAL